VKWPCGWQAMVPIVPDVGAPLFLRFGRLLSFNVPPSAIQRDCLMVSIARQPGLDAFRPPIHSVLAVVLHNDRSEFSLASLARRTVQITRPCVWLPPVALSTSLVVDAKLAGSRRLRLAMLMTQPPDSDVQ
jgi:hypothetical protein